MNHKSDQDEDFLSLERVVELLYTKQVQVGENKRTVIHLLVVGREWYQSANRHLTENSLC